MHQMLSNHIQDVFLAVHDARKKLVKQSKVKFDQMEFNLQINDIVQICTSYSRIRCSSSDSRLPPKSSRLCSTRLERTRTT